MIKNFNEMKKKMKSADSAKKRVAVVVAEDDQVLAAIREAQDDGIAEGVLVGSKSKIEQVAKENKISLDGFEIVDESDHVKAANLCTNMVRTGKASAIMKGSLDTSKFMKAVLNKETGLNTGTLLSLVGVFELPTYPKLLLMTDPGINIAPDVMEKAKLIDNAVKVAKSLDIEKPLVACCAAVEKVNVAAMPATVDAACLAKMNDRGQIKDCIVDGPFGLDNAVSEESARLKKIKSPVAGQADVILCNDIESANYLYKALVFLAGGRNAAVVMGAAAPVILTSRADSHETKYLSIMLSLACA